MERAATADDRRIQAPASQLDPEPPIGDWPRRGRTGPPAKIERRAGTPISQDHAAFLACVKKVELATGLQIEPPTIGSLPR